MFYAIWQFYEEIFFGLGDLEDVGSSIPYLFNDGQIQLFGATITPQEYMLWLMTFITMIIIYILCCLFVWKIIKLIGNLIK